MANTFGNLPPELLMKVVNELIAENDETKDENNKPQHDKLDNLNHLMKWSSTSSYFRNLLAPYIFQSVELRNEEKCGASLVALANGKHAHLVKIMNFFGSAPLDQNEGDLDVTVSEVFPGSAAQVLSNLQDFPHLDELSIEFSYTYYEMPEGLDLYGDEESDEKVLNAEESEAWRALMAKTYKALANNKEKYVKRLTFRDLIFKRASTFTDRCFHDFLSHIESFGLSIRGEENGAWNTNKAEEYTCFAAKLDTMFLDHLLHVKSLTIKAPEEGPLGEPGTEGWSLVPLALKKNQMPFLESAYFEYIIICPQLTDFLIDHRTTLKHLSLHNCFINMLGEEEAHKGIYWEHFFDRLCDAHFEKLCHIEILPLNLSLESQDSQEIENEILRARDIALNPDSGRRLFAYAQMDEKYGTIFPCEEENWVSFKKGKDQKSFDRLMEKVQINAAKRD